MALNPDLFLTDEYKEYYKEVYGSRVNSLSIEGLDKEIDNSEVLLFQTRYFDDKSGEFPLLRNLDEVPFFVKTVKCPPSDAYVSNLYLATYRKTEFNHGLAYYYTIDTFSKYGCLEVEIVLDMPKQFIAIVVKGLLQLVKNGTKLKSSMIISGLPEGRKAKIGVMGNNASTGARNRLRVIISDAKGVIPGKKIGDYSQYLPYELLCGDEVWLPEKLCFSEQRVQTISFHIDHHIGPVYSIHSKSRSDFQMHNLKVGKNDKFISAFPGDDLYFSADVLYHRSRYYAW